MSQDRPRDSHCAGLNSQASQPNLARPSYLEPWILNVLLECQENEAREEGQLGHILKVVNESQSLHYDVQHPAAILHIGDGRCYIQVVVTAKAAQMSKCLLPQSGFSSILGHFITLQNYRVCFKKAANVEECKFYLVLDCFCVTPVKRQRMTQGDCNREPSVLKKIKELWQRSFVMQSCPSSEPSSVSEILREIKQDQLSTLKQNVEACLNMLDAEELAAYPDTKWQVERQQDKMHKDTFTVPGKFLVISEDNEAMPCKDCSSKPPLAVVDTDEHGQDDEISTISFFSAGSENVDDLENPWDIFPGMTLTSSSEMPDTPPSLPPDQQMQLATTAEEEATEQSNSCTPEFLEYRDCVPQGSSSQTAPVEKKTPSPSLFPSHSNECLKELVRQESRLAAHQTSKISDTDESIPCGQILRNSHSQANACLLSSVHSTVPNNLSLEPLPENASENNLACLQSHEMVRGTSEKLLENHRKCAAKRKRMIQDEEEPTETSPNPTTVSQRALQQPSSVNLTYYNKLNGKLVARKRPLHFVSTPKKSRMQEPQVQQQQASGQLRRSERLVEKGKKWVASEVAPGRPGDCCCVHCGAPQQECLARTLFEFTNKPPTPEICTQVSCTRISRALLGWACWVFNSTEKQQP